MTLIDVIFLILFTLKLSGVNDDISWWLIVGVILLGVFANKISDKIQSWIDYLERLNHG